MARKVTGLWDLEVEDNRNQGRSDRVSAVVLVSRRGKKGHLGDDAC